MTEEEFAAFHVPHRIEWAIFLLYCLLLILVPSLLYQRSLRASRQLMSKEK